MNKRLRKPVTAELEVYRAWGSVGGTPACSAAAEPRLFASAKSIQALFQQQSPEGLCASAEECGRISISMLLCLWHSEVFIGIEGGKNVPNYQ